MDNQDSNPQIIIPNVPDDFCPAGDWRTIFQTFIDVVLTNGTVDIPDLSDISPEAIAQIQTDVSNLQLDVIGINANIDEVENDISSINTNISSINTDIVSINTDLTAIIADIFSIKDDILALLARPIITVRTGVINVSTGTSTLNITFDDVPSADYGVSITPIGTATTVAAGKYILQTGQTTTGFTIRVNDNPATVTQLRWTVTHTN
jgi:hypothetical protein